VFSGAGQNIATNPAKQGEVVAKVRDAQRITDVKVIFSRDCSLGHLTDDLAERKFSPTPTLRHLPRAAGHAARRLTDRGPAMPERTVLKGTIG
jgi:hypothetical protein